MFAVPCPKKKSKIGVKKKVHFVLPPPKKVEKKIPDGRKYSQIAPESVKIKAETIGIDELDDDVAKALSEEVSYRLREIVSKCTIYMRQSKRFKLTRSLLKSVLSANDLEYDFGHLTKPTFSLFEEEDIFMLEDEEMDIEEMTQKIIAHKVKDIELTRAKITGRLVIPDKKHKSAASNKKTASETEPLEAKTAPPDKQLKSEVQNKKTTNETEALEALGLRKVLKT